MKEYYGARELHPLDYPIKSYEEQMTECKGMYDCAPLGGTPQAVEHFVPNMQSELLFGLTTQQILVLLVILAFIVMIPYLSK